MKYGEMKIIKRMLAVGIILILLLTGCRSSDSDREAFRQEEEKSTAEKNGRDTAENEMEEEEDFVYLEKFEVWDINDKKARYETYMPRGTEVSDGSAFYYEHGLDYYAGVDSFQKSDEHYESLESLLEAMLESWHEPYEDCMDINSSGILENGDDRYYMITCRRMNYEGNVYETRLLEYVEMQPSGDCIEWSLSVNMEDTDQKTDLIIGELEACYGISLEPMKTTSPLICDESDQDDYYVKEGHKTLEDMEGYQYLGYAVLSDYYEEAFCPVMIPRAKETNVKSEHAFSYLHGVQITVDVNGFYYGNNLMSELEYYADIRLDSLEGNYQRIKNVEKSEMLPVSGYSDSLCMEISYDKKGIREEEYFPKAEILCYIRMDDSNYLSIEIFLSGEKYDASTNTVIRELENAYGIDLSKYYNTSGEEGELSDYGAENGNVVTLAELIEAETAKEEDDDGENEEALSDTILWFNATYAPLTYSNGCDWRIVGGMEASTDNIIMMKQGLKASWNIIDRESALKALGNLKERGHRQICREYLEELEELGLLELEEKEFRRAFLRSDIEDKDQRYIIAYRMYQAGFDADDMAAWDLCRVNQLCADFYLCGYMTYEEAMNESLDNSRILQKMYSSWDEMLGGYMLGFQFWQRDLEIKEGTATMERYRCCEILKESTDSPYELDWNMELQKSW